MRPRKELLKALSAFRRALEALGLGVVVEEVAPTSHGLVSWELSFEGPVSRRLGHKGTRRRLRQVREKLHQDVLLAGCALDPWGRPLVRSASDILLSGVVWVHAEGYALPPLPAGAPAG